jgi:hypothetical protein
MQSALWLLGAAALLLASVATVLGLAILVLHLARYAICLSLRICPPPRLQPDRRIAPAPAARARLRQPRLP